MTLIDFFALTFLTSLTGTLVFAVWKRLSIKLDECEELWLINTLLSVVLLFYMFPLVFVALAFWRGILHSEKLGGFLAATPALVNITRGLAVIWLIGLVIEVLRYAGQMRLIAVNERIGRPAGERSREVAGIVRERLRIKREIPIYELTNCRYPMIARRLTGCCIFIPEHIENDKEMEMMLEHELYHYMKKDLRRKAFCAWIVRFQWFNPYVYRLAKEVDTWGESLCDYHMCYQCGNRWKMKEYFGMIINYAEKKEECSIYGGMYLASDGEGIRRRINLMQRMNRKKEAKHMVIFLSFCFLVASAVTSFAAGECLSILTDTAHEVSSVKNYEEGQAAEQELEEYTKDRSEYGEVVVDEEVNLNSRGLSTYTWDIRAGVVYESGVFWAAKGDKIDISATPSPRTSKIGMGLDQPDGVLRGVSGTGALSHTFTVQYTGFHRVFVENMESKQISVAVAVSR